MAEEQKDAEQTGPKPEEPAKNAAEGEPSKGEAELSKGEEFLEKLTHERSEFSAEDLDEFLEIEDPNFSKAMSEVKKDTTLTMVEVEVDEESAALSDEIEKWRSGSKIRQRIYRVFPFAPHLTLRLKKLRFRAFVLLRAIAIHLKNLAFEIGMVKRKQFQTWLFGQIKSGKDSAAQNFTDLKKLSLKLKLAFGGVLVLAVLGSGVLYLAWKGKLIPPEHELFLKTLETEADAVFEVEDTEELENYYETFRSTPNLLLIQKIVVNLKKSAESSENPMGAMEIFVDGLNPDVVIEVKDREPMFRDLIQRTVEEFSFEDLSQQEGKQKLTKTLLREMNRNLTTGELRSVRIKTLILKP